MLWWDLEELNLRRADLQSAALPTELRSRVAALVGFEPTHSFLPPGFQDRSLKPLEYNAVYNTPFGA